MPRCAKNFRSYKQSARSCVREEGSWSTRRQRVITYAKRRQVHVDLSFLRKYLFVTLLNSIAYMKHVVFASTHFISLASLKDGRAGPLEGGGLKSFGITVLVRRSMAFRSN